jgi:hypothetical protein
VYLTTRVLGSNPLTRRCISPTRKILIQKGRDSVETRKVKDTWTVIVQFPTRTLTHKVPADRGYGWDENTAARLANQVYAVGKLDPALWVEV